MTEEFIATCTDEVEEALPLASRRQYRISCTHFDSCSGPLSSSAFWVSCGGAAVAVAPSSRPCEALVSIHSGLTTTTSLLRCSALAPYNLRGQVGSSAATMDL
mmetsp:Transcript_74230/g.176839  ORF Transcript_74230/g.176839 Transcript_74230/m.176839 type:complete len:103 (+) Transcript_74230:94-402(+)